MDPIRLDDISAIPADIKAALAEHDELLRKSRSLENLCESNPLWEIAKTLHRHIYSGRVLGYHCTKEPEQRFFISNGLRLLDRKQHQNEFLKRYGYKFTDTELKQITDAWNSYFTGDQDDSRNGRIAFCFTPYLVTNNGTDVFFRYFGGEAVFMPLKKHKSIIQTLEGIGNPVVVTFPYKLDPKEPYTSFSLANTLLSHYHRTLNPNALILSKEGFMKSPVSGSEIIAVTLNADFFKEYT